MNQKIDTKKAIQSLIKQDGFSNVAGILGEVAKEEEILIRNTNDSHLRQAFEYSLYALMDCYKGAGEKNKKQIRNLMEVDSVKYSLDLLNWESSKHCDSMKSACKTIKGWRNVQPS